MSRSSSVPSSSVPSVPVPYNTVTAPLFLVAWVVARRLPVRSEKGQATVEYALVLLGAIGLAIAVFVLIRKPGRLEGIVDGLFKKVTDELGSKKW